MIPIPYGTRYFVTVSGQVEKSVVCESCKCQHLYVSAWQATASTLSFFDLLSERTAHKKAEQKARAILEHKLREPEFVACPRCGWFQSPMIDLRKRQQLRFGLKLVAGLVAVTWFVALAVGQHGWPAIEWAAACGALGVGIVLARRITYDPNARVTETQRKALAAASKATPIETYRAMQAQRTLERVQRDAQLFASGGAVLDELASVDEQTARKRRQRAQQRRDRQAFRWLVAAILLPSLAAAIGIGIDLARFPASESEVFDRFVLALAVPPFVGLMCLLFTRATYSQFYAGATDRGARLPSPRTVELLVGLSVTVVVATYMAVARDRPTIHGYAAAATSEAVLLMVMGFVRWRQGRESGAG